MRMNPRKLSLPHVDSDRLACTVYVLNSRKTSKMLIPGMCICSSPATMQLKKFSFRKAETGINQNRFADYKFCTRKDRFHLIQSRIWPITITLLHLVTLSYSSNVPKCLHHSAGHHSVCASCTENIRLA